MMFGTIVLERIFWAIHISVEFFGYFFKKIFGSIVGSICRKLFGDFWNYFLVILGIFFR